MEEAAEKGIELFLFINLGNIIRHLGIRNNVNFPDLLPSDIVAVLHTKRERRRMKERHKMKEHHRMGKELNKMRQGVRRRTQEHCKMMQELDMKVQELHRRKSRMHRRK